MTAAVHRLYAIQEADPDPLTIPAAPDWQRQREAEASRHRPGAWSDARPQKAFALDCGNILPIEGRR
jgi:hypothetical protein